MFQKVYDKPHDLGGLWTELVTAGIAPFNVTDDPDGFRIEVETFDPTPDGVTAERAAIQSKADAVVAAHDLAAVLAARQAAADAAQAAATETTAAKSDLATNYQAAQSQLDTILAATSMTNVQLFAAVQTEARILKRTLRLAKAALT